MQRLWVKVAVAAVALAVVIVVAIPFLVNADTFRPKLEDQLSNAMERKIALGHLGFSVLRGSIVAENIAISDDPAFSTSPFIQAKSLYIGVETGALVFHRQVRITKLTVDSPAIRLIQSQSGIWNFSSFGNATASTAPQSQSALPDLTIGELKINDGSASVSSLPDTGKPFVYTGIDLAIQQLSFLKSFPFRLSAKLPGGGWFDLNGNAGPLAQKNTADTPFSAALKLHHFDPVAAGVLEPSAGISMNADIDAQLSSDGVALTSKGKIQASRLQLAHNGSPAQRPVDIDFAISQDLETRVGRVSDISVHTGSVVAHVSGGYRLTGQGAVLDLHLAAQELPIDQLEQLLPTVGVKLPSGSALKGGTLTASLAATGPASAITVTGPVEVDNTMLAGFDLGSKIEGLNPFGRKGGGTTIQTLRAEVSSSPQSTQFTNIQANLPEVGTASGDGCVAASGALDFNLTAKFNSSTGVGAVANEAVNVVSGLLGGFRSLKLKAPASSNNGIPLTITGTASNPHIRANFRAMLK